MRKNIHPTYYSQTKVHCVCGNVFTVGSTREEIYVDICSRCHPFYTGKEKIIDTAGRVEKFKTRRLRAEATRIDKKMRGSLRRPQKRKKS